MFNMRLPEKGACIPEKADLFTEKLTVILNLGIQYLIDSQTICESRWASRSRAGLRS